jgi:hypothetical protein
MPYTINKFNGEQLVVLEDGTIDTTTSLGLVGRNYVGYGETHNENFVFLLENFSNDAPPSRPLKGQAWFDSVKNLLNVWDGLKWVVVGTPLLSITPPDTPSQGALWLKIPFNTLYVYDGTEWILVGPEAAEGFGATKARSTTLKDDSNTPHAVIFLTVDDTVIAICSSIAFTISASNPVTGFLNLAIGITMSSASKVTGDLTGVADRAKRLESSRKINGVNFDGTSDVTLKASTTNRLLKGDYLTGSNFDGSAEITWSVDATSSNTIGKVVVRNSSGGFSAGTINATFVGDLTGNVTASSGTSTFDVVEANTFIGATLSGNASTATRLELPRTINGVAFDGTENVTVPASAQTLTGTYINTTVVNSNLQGVGTLGTLNVTGTGIHIGDGAQKLHMTVAGTASRLYAETGTLNFSVSSNPFEMSLVNSTRSVELGGPSVAALIGNNTTNIGLPAQKFDKVYANEFKGNADTATLATTATNLAGGATGSIPYQIASGNTTLLPIGASGQFLQAQPGNTVGWATINIFSRGMVMQWYGSSASVPTGWQVCDGTNGTPDLRDKFVVGAGSTYTLGASGGSAAVNKTVSINLTSGASGDHSHSGYSGSTTLTEAQIPQHRHYFYDIYGIWGDQPGNYRINGGTPVLNGPEPSPAWYSGFRDADGNLHGQYFYYSNASDGDQDGGAFAIKNVTLPAGSPGATGAHNHTISASGSHTHSVVGSSNITVDIVPPYVALFYIMKL